MDSAFFNGKKLAIVGAGRGQLGLYLAAKRLGITIVSIGSVGNYPSLKYADVICDVDIKDCDAVLKAARANNVDAIVTSCMDMGIESVGHVCDQMGLIGLSRAAAAQSFDKLAQKKVFVDANIPTASVVFATTAAEVERAAKAFGFPLVIKKRQSQGSSGVCVTEDMQEALEFVSEEIANGETFLVEEYLEGDEFGAQAFIAGGEVRFVLPHGDVLMVDKAPMPTGHYYPVDQADNVIADSIDIAKRAIKACGYDDCAINIDFRMHNGDVYLMELTGRAGASGLPELTSAYFGVDYYEAVVRLAFGDRVFLPVEKAPASPAALAQLILPAKSGVIAKININPVDPIVFEARAFIEEGEEVEVATNLKGVIGQVAAKSASLDQCFDAVNCQIDQMFVIE